MITCRYCGRNVKEEDVICGYCGYNTKTGVLSSVPKKEGKAKTEAMKKSGSQNIFFPFIGILVIIAFSAVLLTGNSRNIIPYLRGMIGRYIHPKQKASANGKLRQAKKAPEPKGILEKIFPEKPVKAKSNKDFNLEGIFFDPSGKSLATVNEKVVGEGEKVRNILVVKINSDSLEVEVGGTSKILKVGQSIPFPKD